MKYPLDAIETKEGNLTNEVYQQYPRMPPRHLVPDGQTEKQIVFRFPSCQNNLH
ncbi:hypothetical protein D3C80_2139400 [compost metagenome]